MRLSIIDYTLERIVLKVLGAFNLNYTFVYRRSSFLFLIPFQEKFQMEAQLFHQPLHFTTFVDRRIVHDEHDVIGPVLAAKFLEEDFELGSVDAVVVDLDQVEAVLTGDGHDHGFRLGLRFATLRRWRGLLIGPAMSWHSLLRDNTFVQLYDSKLSL